MFTKKILSWLLLLFGEAIIIASFILLKGYVADDVPVLIDGELILNIVVSSIIYVMFFLNFRAPWIDLRDKSRKHAGALGIRWLTAWLYAVFAIATMVVANICYPLAFTVQLLIHCGLLFFLLLGMLLARHAADKVEEVYRHEQSDEVKKYRERIEALKRE